MTHYYCTCTASTDEKKIFLVSRGRTPYRKVKVDKEGLCENCGHYPVATNREMPLGTNKLYNYITGHKDGITNKRRHINKQVRDRRSKNDEKRADKDGDLDAQ